MPINWDKHNFYELLEVSPKASTQEIENAFKLAKSTYSQDNPALYGMFSEEEASQLMTLIDEAFAVLSDPGMRKSYDRALAARNRNSADQQELNLETADSGGVIPEATAIGFEDRGPKAVPESKPTTPPPPPISEPIHLPPNSYSPQQLNYEQRKSAGTVSSFKSDEAFEEEIQNCEVFDGELLKKIRLYKNVSLEDISEASRIGRHYLRAIEDNDFGQLPAPVFVRGFVIQYARVLQLDPDRVARSYMKIYKDFLGK